MNTLIYWEELCERIWAKSKSLSYKGHKNDNNVISAQTDKE